MYMYVRYMVGDYVDSASDRGVVYDSVRVPSAYVRTVY